MFCRFCGNQLDDNIEVCPHCGESVDAGKKKAEQKKRIGKVLKIVALVLVAALLVTALVFGLKKIFRANDVHYKDNYSVADDAVDASRDTVVATMGDATLTNSQLQVYYWVGVVNYLTENEDYLAYYGLDYTQPLNEQIYNSEEDLTWQQYFLEEALNTWKYYQALAQDAEANGYVPPEVYDEYFAVLKDSMTEMAESYELTLDEMIESDFGPGVSFEDYEYYLKLYYLGNLYFGDLSGELEADMEEIEAYFAENEATFAEGGITKESGDLIDVRHILIKPEGGTLSEDGKTTVYSDDEWEACRAEAQVILDQWLAGDATEDTFAELANEHSEDGGSNTAGGLYTFVAEGDMVEAFNDWCFDESRKEGDYGLVKTEYGYHIMYFVTGEEGWIRYSRSDVITEKATAVLEELLSNYERETDYKKISLGA